MRTRRESSPEPELNLAPIMNMVVILIPLLLLSVVFLSVGVINVTMPPLSPSVNATSDTGALKLTVAISAKGFRVETRDGLVPGGQECERNDVTVCLTDPGADLKAAFERTKSRPRDGVHEVLNAYDFAGLYAVLDRMKSEHPGETKLVVTADEDVPYAVVTRVMDAARYRVDGAEFVSSSAFWGAQERRKGGHVEALFPDAVIAIAR